MQGDLHDVNDFSTTWLHDAAQFFLGDGGSTEALLENMAMQVS